MDSNAVNVVAIAVSLAAVGVSSFIALRQATLSRQANQVLTFVDLLSESRSADFRRREHSVWTKLPDQPPGTTFAALPDDVRMDVEVVCSFYSALAYCIAIGVLDTSLALAPLRYRLLKTWDLVYPLLLAERAERGDGDSYFSLLEDMVGAARMTDQRRTEQRLSRQAFPMLHVRRQWRRVVVAGAARLVPRRVPAPAAPPQVENLAGMEGQPPL